MSRSFLFAAVLSDTWGEVLVALRIADQLDQAGHRVVFVAPEAMRMLLSGKPYRLGWIDRSLDHLATALPEIARRERCDAVVLVDCALVYMQLACTGQAAGFVERFDVPVIALDMWDLPAGDMTWDLGDAAWRHSVHALEPKRRVVPAPLASPTRGPGTFAALFPPRQTINTNVRVELGAGENEPLVLLPTATWQTPSSQQRPYARRIAELFPEWIATLVAGIDAPLRLVHVGPRPLPSLRATLGDRYRHLDQMPPARFVDLVGAADLLLSFNASATSIALAISLGVPVLLGQLARGGTAGEISGELDGPSPALLDWLRRVGELHPFRVWPLGYSTFLAPLLADNPYLDAVCAVDVLDETGFQRAAGELLSPGAARDALGERQRDYAKAIAALPSGAAAVLEQLD